MVKVYCKDCKMLLFEKTGGFLGGLANLTGSAEEKKTGYVEFEDGYKCERCANKRGGMRK